MYFPVCNYSWIHIFDTHGTLRASVALCGHPISAFTMKVRVATAEDVGLVELDNPENSTIYRIESHIPHEKPTDSDLENWIVYKHFCFYTAKYYGWC